MLLLIGLTLFLHPRCFCLAIFLQVGFNAKQKHLGHKKCEANQNIVNRQVQPKTLILAEAKKLLYQTH